MSLNNLHSLINGKWFIEDAFAKSLLPSFFNVLENKSFHEKDVVDFSIKTSTSIINGASFNSNDNKESYVLVLNLKSPIYKYDQSCGPRGTKSKIATMKAYENDVHCKGVVLDIDSGGGQVAGTPEFHDFIKEYSKPVVAYTDGLMCSAAYYIAAATSYIVANKRAEKIGSIGTMVSFLDMTGYYEKKGAKLITAYASKSTEKNKDFKELVEGNPEGFIKNELDPITDTFHADMKAARENLDATVLSGGTFDPEQSLTLGLIDTIGTLQTAIDKIHELANANPTNTNKNSNNMSKKYENIQAALGYDTPFESNEKGFYFSEAEMQSLEDVLAGDNKKLIEAAVATATKETTDSLQTANDTATKLTTAIDTSLEAAGLERESRSDQEAVALLSEKVIEYGQFDGAKPTNTLDDASDDVDETKNLVGGIDISTAMNN